MVTDRRTRRGSYLIPYGSRLRVSEGDEVQAGDMPHRGLGHPHDVLAIKGESATQDYLIQESAVANAAITTYRMQGV